MFRILKEANQETEGGRIRRMWVKRLMEAGSGGLRKQDQETEGGMIRRM